MSADNPLVLRLRADPEQRLDLSPLTPERLAGKSEREIAAIELHTNRQRVTAGEVFSIAMGSAERLVIEGGSDRLDRVGEGMTAGTITVEGDVGNRTGCRLAEGARLLVRGRTGHFTAAGMRGGYLEVTGDVGDRLAGPLPGETQGMRGGVLVVRGRAGDRAGDRLRRGLLVIEAGAGDGLGSRMLAGTILVPGPIGREPGYLMRRGTVVVSAAETPGPTFVDCGIHSLVALKLMARFLEDISSAAAALLSLPSRRYAGDMAVLGKGEFFVIGTR